MPQTTDHQEQHAQMTNSYLTSFVTLVRRIAVSDVLTLIRYLETALHEDRHIYVIGNGGSAATASHFACDLGKLAYPGGNGKEGRRFRITSLTDNMAWISAVANDIDFRLVFSEQIRNVMRPGDLLIAISVSGQSGDILDAIRATKQVGATAIAILGCNGGIAKELADASLVVPSNDFGLVESIHLMLVHLATATFATVSDPETAWTDNNNDTTGEFPLFAGAQVLRG